MDTPSTQANTTSLANTSQFSSLRVLRVNARHTTRTLILVMLRLCVKQRVQEYADASSPTFWNSPQEQSRSLREVKPTSGTFAGATFCERDTKDRFRSFEITPGVAIRPAHFVGSLGQRSLSRNRSQ